MLTSERGWWSELDRLVSDVLLANSCELGALASVLLHSNKQP